VNLPALKEIIEERKEKAIDKLSDSYARNRLPLEEYERLVEYINKIESERELVVVEKIVAEYDSSGAKPAYEDDDEDEDDTVYNPHYGDRGISGSNLTVLSTRTFQGPIKSGTQFMSLLGSGQIKIRKADLSKRRTSLNIVAILGDFSVFVEPGINVINNAVPVLGTADVNHKVAKMAAPGEPELVISGTALLGTISVKLLKEGN
jgi:hypothetical protein